MEMSLVSLPSARAAAASASASAAAAPSCSIPFAALGGGFGRTQASSSSSCRNCSVCCCVCLDSSAVNGVGPSSSAPPKAWPSWCYHGGKSLSLSSGGSLHGKELRLKRRRASSFSFATRAAANAEKVEAPTPASTTPAESEEAKNARRAADWKKAEKLKETGAVHRGRVDAFNSGGLLVRIGSLQGFLPFSLLSGARLSRGPDPGKTVSEIGNELVGDIVSVKVIEVVEADRRLIFSEKAAVLAEIIQQVKEGTVYKGKVNFVTDYGAFVDLQFPDGSYPVSGLVHMSELSWDPVPFPQDFISQGQEVTVKVVQVDRENLKIALSMRQLEADPLLETLDTLMPAQDESFSVGTVNAGEELVATPLPGLEQICDYILQEEGISDIQLGRQALERRVVSQDLELWLANASVEDGRFTLLARAGRQVQEVYLRTTLDREGIKAAVQRVTGRVP